MFDGGSKLLKEQADLLLVLGVIGILFILFAPIPSQLLDVLIIVNVSFSLLILLLTFYVEKPIKFSTFPSLLLIATLFRLSLNIAATRLILGNGDAGRVIKAVGERVVSGNYVIGLIVFLVLIVVQYVVVTNGAQRVAEVAARFTLDSMPGKQMSIDADMNAGLIDEEEAKKRRKDIEKEANFYGAMDGASKFVKGDAIAGIIIILIDIVGGLTIGVAQNGMQWSEALQVYTLLTVGDGIVTQIPALIISTGTGLIVTRAASDDFLSKEIAGQITAYPKTYVLIAVGLFGLLFLPGIPALPVMGVLLVVILVAVYSFKAKSKRDDGAVNSLGNRDGEGREDIYAALMVEPIEVTVGQAIASAISGGDRLFMERVAAFRKQFAMDVGVVIPPVRVKDSKRVGNATYEIRIFGAKVAHGELNVDGVLAINPGGVREEIPGKETVDPTYGLPAVWILKEQISAARTAGYTIVEPMNVLMTHLADVIRTNAPSILTRSETEKLIGRVKEINAGLVEELIPSVLTLSEVQKVLQNLLQEKISIRNLEQILEVLVDAGKQNKDAEILTEMVRGKLGSIIVQALTNQDGELHVLTLEPGIERMIASNIRAVGDSSSVVLEPRVAEGLLKGIARQVEKMIDENVVPVLLCAPEIRRHLYAFTSRVIPHLSVLSMTEIPSTVRLRSFAMVEM